MALFRLHLGRQVVCSVGKGTSIRRPNTVSRNERMIARYWTARATVEGARAYVEFFQRTLVPQLARLEGHRGALVFDRPLDDGVEVTVLTLRLDAAISRR